MDEKIEKTKHMIDLKHGHISLEYLGSDRVKIVYINKALMWGDNKFEVVGVKDMYSGSATFNGLSDILNRLVAISDYAVTMFLSGYLTEEGLQIANESRNEVQELTILALNHSL